jgi:hypothetical protein
MALCAHAVMIASRIAMGLCAACCGVCVLWLYCVLLRTTTNAANTNTTQAPCSRVGYGLWLRATGLLLGTWQYHWACNAGAGQKTQHFPRKTQYKTGEKPAIKKTKENNPKNREQTAQFPQVLHITSVLPSLAPMPARRNARSKSAYITHHEKCTPTPSWQKA